MDQAQTAPRTLITAILAALALALLTLVVAMGLPGLAADVAGNGWHKTSDSPRAGNGWHKTGSVMAGNGWHSNVLLGNGWH